jgi:maspardin
MPSKYSLSEEYKKFKSWVALRKVLIDHEGVKTWRYYDFGPREAVPIIFLHGASGTAEVFYRQIVGLCPKGYRMLTVQYPAYSSHDSWIRAFDKFVDELKFPKFHLFGTALGGYLAQCYTKYRGNRILSLLLCNSFCDTQYYSDSNPFSGVLSWTPDFVLKRVLLQDFPEYPVEPEISNSIEFILEQVETLSPDDITSRLSLNCTVGPLVATSLQLDQDRITIIDCIDDFGTPERVRDEVHKLLPDARKAFLKSGGNFPYLSRAQEVNLHIEIHLLHCNYEKMV